MLAQAKTLCWWYFRDIVDRFDNGHPNKDATNSTIFVTDITKSEL